MHKEYDEIPVKTDDLQRSFAREAASILPGIATNDGLLKIMEYCDKNELIAISQQNEMRAAYWRNRYKNTRAILKQRQATVENLEQISCKIRSFYARIISHYALVQVLNKGSIMENNADVIIAATISYLQSATAQDFIKPAFTAFQSEYPTLQAAPDFIVTVEDAIELLHSRIGK